jgi:Asp/Glu/hydantoin racemase
VSPDRPRIGVVHALYDSIRPIETAFAEGWPEAETVSLYDQSLYADFDRHRRITEAIRRRVATLLALSVESGARAVLFSGSLFGEAVIAARVGLGVPVLTAYEALIEDAFAAGRRLGLLTTAAGTGELMEADIAAYAAGQGIGDHRLETRFVEGAMEALRRGERDTHDALVARAAEDLEGCDVLLLGQFSMAPAAARIASRPGRRVLTSSGSAAAKMRRLVDRG